MTPYSFKPTAALFFFKNGVVDVDAGGGLSFVPYSFSTWHKPNAGDIIIDRDYVDVDFTDGDFYKFLRRSSPSKKSFVKKALAIGYMLCNMLPRGGRRCRAFLCANEGEGACANGKTLFARAIAQFCKASFASKDNTRSQFWLNDVDERTNLLILDDMPSHFDYNRVFNLCTDAWIVRRKAQDALVIPREAVPYVLITTSTSVKMIRQDNSFLRRFVILEFSSNFGLGIPIDKIFGHTMFDGWDTTQWNMFDNFMLDCLMQYLHCSCGGDEDIFELYQ